MIKYRQGCFVFALTAAVLLGCVTAAQAAEGRNQGSGELTLSVTCKANGEDPADGSLTFVLWDGQFSILQWAVNLRGYVSFAPLHFSAPGRYIYYISQEGGGDLSVVYDTAVYQIVVIAVEYGSGITAEIAQVNRVSGDPVGEPRIVETFDRRWIPVFENSTRQLSAPPAAEVPQTGCRAGWQPAAFWISGAGLLLAAAGKRRNRAGCGNSQRKL